MSHSFLCSSETFLDGLHLQFKQDTDIFILLYGIYSLCKVICWLSVVRENVWCLFDVVTPHCVFLPSIPFSISPPLTHVTDDTSEGQFYFLLAFFISPKALLKKYIYSSAFHFTSVVCSQGCLSLIIFSTLHVL